MRGKAVSGGGAEAILAWNGGEAPGSTRRPRLGHSRQSPGLSFVRSSSADRGPTPARRARKCRLHKGTDPTLARQWRHVDHHHKPSRAPRSESTSMKRTVATCTSRRFPQPPPRFQCKGPCLQFSWAATRKWLRAGRRKTRAARDCPGSTNPRGAGRRIPLPGLDGDDSGMRAGGLGRDVDGHLIAGLAERELAIAGQQAHR